MHLFRSDRGIQAEALHLLCRPLCCWLRHAAEQAGEQVRLLLDGGVSNSAPQITH